MDRYLKENKSSVGESDGASTDDGKRKAGEDCGEFEESSFRRSKKTPRTPHKDAMGEKGKLDTILEMMKELKTEVKQIRVEQREYMMEINKLKTENNLLREGGELLKRENAEIKTELKTLKNSIEILEREKRANNIVMTGLEVAASDPGVLKEATENFFRQNLKVETKVKSVHKLGPKTCLIQLEDEQQKREVMREKSKLRNLRDNRVYLNDDLTKGERHMQKVIRETAKEERKNGKDVKIGVRKLMINGVEWRWSREQEKLEAITEKK